MPESTVITDQKDTTEDEKKEKSIGQEVREKSFSQLLTEQAEERNATTSDEPKAPDTTEDDAKKAEEEKLAKEADEAKRQVEADEADQKRQAELATKAAEEVIARQKADEQEKLDKQKEEQAKLDQKEDLKPRFTGRDRDGNVVPKDYEELAQESARIGREEALAEFEARQKTQEEARVRQAAEASQKETEQKNIQKSFEDQLQKELDSDLTDLYANDKLPKVGDPNDENDEGNKEFKNLFETAQRVNAERIAKGEAPIRSIKLIYYEHYKPLAKPAGHDAPVIGNESPLSHEAPDDQYIPSRDRHKSMTQLIKEEKERITRKMNIRGV